MLVPALQVDGRLIPLHLEHAHHLGVVGSGKVEVGHRDVDVRQSQDSHASLPSAPEGSLWWC